MFGDTPLIMVESDAALKEAVASMLAAPVIGVDTESDSFHHYQEKVCLVQISDLENDYIIDPLSIDDMGPLGEVFADRRITKVFHGADYDVVCMKRDFKFEFRGIFDTMISAQFLGLPGVGLADLIRTWWGWTIDKKWQRHDWASRPLLDEHLDYARGDSHWLPALRDVMTEKLRRLGRLAPVLEECLVMERREWQGRTHDPADFLRVKGSRELDDAGKRALRALWAYRDAEAAAMDRPAFKVIPEPVLLELARRRADDLDAVGVVTRRGSPLFRRHGERLAAAVAEGLATTDELPTPAPKEGRERGPGPGLRGRDAERLFLRLKDWRNEKVARSGLPAITVASNGLLRELTRAAPTDAASLRAVPELRAWQFEQFGAELLGLIGVAAPRAPLPDGDLAPRKRRRRRRGGSGGSAESTDDAPSASQTGTVEEFGE